MVVWSSEKNFELLFVMMTSGMVMIPGSLIWQKAPEHNPSVHNADNRTDDFKANSVLFKPEQIHIMAGLLTYSIQ